MSQLTALLKSQQDKNGVTLFDHLYQFLFNLTHQKDGNKQFQSIECFELLSDFAKKNRYVYQQPKTDDQVNKFNEQQPEWSQLAKLIQELLNSNRELQQPLPCALQNFINDARALENAGIGFGEEESYKIQLSIKRLAAETQSIQLVFWGKILTRGKDYFVAQGVTPQLPNDQLSPNSEPRGQGVNFYTYWVTHDILTDWQELPLVSPEQVIAARSIKYVCTGDLNAQLTTYPPFPGKEKHFLKVQIARISHANMISPKGLYQPTEANPKDIEYAEDFKFPEFSEFANIENWVHTPAAILKLGRTSHWVDPTLPAEVGDKIKEELNEFDAEVDRLKGINEDRPFETYPDNWLIKTAGELQQYNPSKEDGSIGIYGITLLKNYTWPGALTVAYVYNFKYIPYKKRGSFVNLYVGYGLKNSQPTFVPISPNDLQQEPDEQEEQYEPNPKTLPKPKPIVDPLDQVPVDDS